MHQLARREMTERYWLTVEEVAHRLGRTRETLRVWRRDGKGPPFFCVGGRIQYRADEFGKWLENQRG